MAKKKTVRVGFEVTDLELVELLSMSIPISKAAKGSKMPIVTLMQKIKEAALSVATDDQKLVVYKLANLLQEAGRELSPGQLPFLDYMSEVQEKIIEGVDSTFTAKQKRLVTFKM